MFGMGIDLALILGVMGTVWTGNPLSLDPGFSIGGTAAGDRSDNILGNLVGVLGTSPPVSALLTVLTPVQAILEGSRAHTTGSSRILLLREMIFM